MTAPFGNRTIEKSTANGTILYNSTLDNTATTLVAGQYTFTGTGGADVGPFTATLNLAQPLSWTNPPATVNRSSGVTITWTGGDPSGYVDIGGTGVFIGTTTANSGAVSFTCTARTTDGSFTVPPVVLLALPPSAVLPGTSSTVPGGMILMSASAGTAFQANGLSLGGAITSEFIYSNPVTFQ